MDSRDRQHLKAFVENRSHEAFGALVEAHADLVSRIVYKRIDAPDSAADLVQEVFCKLAAKAPSLTTHPSIAGWLIRVAILECRKFHRKETNRMKRESMHAADQEMRDGQTPYAEEDFLAVEEALAGLPAIQRDAIMLRFYEKAPFRLIGERFGKSEGAAQKLVARTVERLRRHLSKRRPGITTNTTAFTTALTGILATAPLNSEAARSIATAALKISSSSGAILTTTLLPIMTANQIKLTAAIGLAALLPLAYHWHTESSSRKKMVVPSEVGVEPKLADSTGKEKLVTVPVVEDARLVPSSTSQMSKTPIDWKQSRYQSLIDDLLDSEWKIRRGAAAVLKDGEVPAELAVPALSKALTDGQWHVRKTVAEALAAYGEDAAEAVPQLINALDDEEWHVRKPAAEALAAIGSLASDAARKLIDTLDDEEWQVRNAAAMALVSIPNAEAVPALSKALSDEEWHVAANAGMALANIGPDAEASIGDLMRALHHEQWHVRNNAAHALGSIGNERAIERLKASLDDEEERVRESAAEALARIQENPVL